MQQTATTPPPPVLIFANVFFVILLSSFIFPLLELNFALQCLFRCMHLSFLYHLVRLLWLLPAHYTYNCSYLLICTGRLGQYTHSKEKRRWREKEKRRRTFDITEKQDFPKQEAPRSQSERVRKMLIFFVVSCVLFQKRCSVQIWLSWYDDDYYDYYQRLV